jgi:hypothetical protein
MLTKAVPASQKEATLNTDYASIVAELSRLLPELEEKIKEVTAKYTEVVEPRDTPVQLRVKSKVAEGIVGKAVAWVKSFLSGVTSWATGYDKKLASIKKSIHALG